MTEAEKSLMDHNINNDVKSSSSDPNPCPICLAPVTNDAYLDQCFHRFCYKCILQWIKIVSTKRLPKPSSVKCPLCKTENFSIIHGYTEGSFQRHYVNMEPENRAFFSKAHKYRLQCYYTEADALIDSFNVSRYWKLCKYIQPNRWLHDWLKRELQALIQEEDVDVIVHHIIGVIDSFKRNKQNHSQMSAEEKADEFKMVVSQAANPFLTGRTDKFVNQLQLFLASGLNIEAFDQVYIQHLSSKNPETITEDEDEDEEQLHEHAPHLPDLYFLDEDSDKND